MAAVDPDGRHPQRLGWDVVVVEALGHVEDPFTRHLDPLEREREVGLVGLVGADLLGGDDPVERDSEPRFEEAKRSSSQLVMTPSLNRACRRASASAESAKAGQSPTEPENREISSPVGSTSRSAHTPRSDRPSTSR
jgi:hypothetical protein